MWTTTLSSFLVHSLSLDMNTLQTVCTWVSQNVISPFLQLIWRINSIVLYCMPGNNLIGAPNFPFINWKGMARGGRRMLARKFPWLRGMWAEWCHRINGDKYFLFLIVSIVGWKNIYASSKDLCLKWKMNKLFPHLAVSVKILILQALFKFCILN